MASKSRNRHASCPICLSMRLRLRGLVKPDAAPWEATAHPKRPWLRPCPKASSRVPTAPATCLSGGHRYETTSKPIPLVSSTHGCS